MRRLPRRGARPTRSPRFREARIEPAPRDARADVEAALARQGLKATAIERGDDQRLRVTLDAVSFDALVTLLDTLQRDARLSAVDVTAAARVEPGQVRAEMTFASPR